MIGPVLLSMALAGAAGQVSPRPVGPPQSRLGTDEAGVPATVELVRDVVYAERPSAVPGVAPRRLTFDAAFPRRGGRAPLPVVIYVHGGGYSGGDKRMGLPFTVAFAEGGYFAVTVEYRLSGEAPFPAAVDDCKAAVRFIRRHAEDLAIDPQRIGVWGHSAGGHLSALVAVTGNSDAFAEAGDGPGSSAVRCAVAVSGPVDFLMHGGERAPLPEWLGREEEAWRRNAEAASPLRYVDAGDPPMLLLHGTEDRLVPIAHAEKLRERLGGSGVAVELVAIEGAGHRVADPEAYRRIAGFFDLHLGGTARGRFERPAAPDMSGGRE